LYAAAQGVIEQAGGELIADPFAHTGFAALGAPAPGLDHFDPRGMETVPYDMEMYLRRMGKTAAFGSWQELSAHVRSEDPFGKGGVLEYMTYLAPLAAALADPTSPPDTTDFVALREAYLSIFNRVMDDAGLDVLVFPQMRDETPALHGAETIHETTVCEINIAGLPALTLPAGSYASGVPFNLVFVGRMWSEARLLDIGAAFEVAQGQIELSGVRLAKEVMA
ncbi:amidase, partial [Thioclava sp. BHET1]